MSTLINIMDLKNNSVIMEGKVQYPVQEVIFPGVMTPTCSTNGVHVTVKSKGTSKTFCYDRRAMVEVKG